MRRSGEFRNGLVGIDFSGWRDRVVRNWRISGDGAPEAAVDGHLVEAGPLSCTVLVGPTEDLKRIAGPGARLAPHGRGDGWGARGAAHLRRSLRSDLQPEDLALTLKELASRPAIAVLGIPDLPEMTDAAREARLVALRQAGARRGILAWSSVLLCLDQLTSTSLPAGTRVGIIELDALGFRLQTLDIRERDGVSVPRRRKMGHRTESSMGLANREHSAKQSILKETDEYRLSKVIDQVDLPGLLALEAPGRQLRELIRLGNGDWMEVEATAPKLEEITFDLSEFDQTDIVIFHTPASFELAEAIHQSLSTRCSAPVVLARPEAVAHGAFQAARRLRNGLPLWFDFLPRIDTIVSRAGEAVSFPLIPEDEDVEAGQIWTSPKPLELRWPGGSNELRVWLRKEDADWPRLAPARSGSTPEQTVDVLLRVEQSPAQGRAKLTLLAPDWAPLRDTPAVVEWEEGKIEEKDWSTIIDEESGPRPSIPTRVILPGDARMWTDEGSDLSGALASFDGNKFSDVYRALSQRKALDWQAPDRDLAGRKYYAIDSDGGRPDGVADQDWNRLINVVGCAEEKLVSGDVIDNHAFGVLSWVFHRCPESIWPIAVQVLKSRGGPPGYKGWHTIYPQGLGRIARSDNSLRACIDFLDDRSDDWNMNEQACASFLLSRNDSVFQLLDPVIVTRWTNRIERLLNQQY